MHTLYRVTNTKNGKLYIGQTSIPLNRRWRQHVRDAKRLDIHFSRAISKHGETAFTVSEIATVPTQEKANIAEKHYIQLFQSSNHGIGYNTALGGYGGVQTEEVRKKMSASAKALWEDPIRRERMSEARRGEKNGNYGKHRPPHVIEAMRKANTGRKLSAEHLEKLRIASTGKRPSDEIRKKISDARKRDWQNPEYAEKHRQALRSAVRKAPYPPLAKENLEKLQVARKRWWEGVKNSPETAARYRTVVGMYLSGHTFLEITNALHIASTTIHRELERAGVLITKNHKRKNV